jgi:hypothetical protein
MPLEVRSNSRVPTSCSSSAIALVSALCATLSMRDAAASDPLSATAMK